MRRRHFSRLRAGGKALAGVVCGEQNADFFEQLANSGDPKSQGLARTKMRADDLACLFSESPVQRDIAGGEQSSLMTEPPGKQYMPPRNGMLSGRRVRNTSKPFGSAARSKITVAACRAFAWAFTGRRVSSPSPKEFRQGAPAQ